MPVVSSQMDLFEQSLLYTQVGLVSQTGSDTVGLCVHTELPLKPGSLEHEVAQAHTCFPVYALNFFSTLLSNTALVATVMELALMAKAPTSGTNSIPKG